MKIIVGLGNPGAKYVRTRHNVGFLFVDYLRQMWDFEDFKEKSKFKAYVSEGTLDGEKVVLVKPTTFMNNSGESVVALENFYKAGFENFYICYDDVDLMFPDIRFRDSGSAGTHNGMRSVIDLTGTQEIPRMRFGVDKENRRAELRNYVLNDFSAEEIEQIPSIFEDALKKLREKLDI